MFGDTHKPLLVHMNREQACALTHHVKSYDRVPYITVAYLLTVDCFTEMGKRSYCLGF